ncbi:MAG: hypothetical protein NC218_10940 [Acetobacter sp.]|nr:hypothetical protein [Acetobacter sp.]
MSEKTAASTNKKSFSKALKWGAIILGISVLEGAGIAAAVKITESRNTDNTAQYQSILTKLQIQNNRISDLEKIPSAVSVNAEKIASNTGMVNLVAEGLSALKNEVGNKKVELLNVQMEKLIHRMETVEESKNQEALILSLALLIKENVLYSRSYAKEIAILAELAQGQENIESQIRDILSLENVTILNDAQLIEQYQQIVANLNFASPTKENEEETENRSAVAKSIEMIKDTVAGINLDKVVVLKKEKKTDEQQLLINTLTNLVNAHNFKDAIEFIEQNRASFYEELNPEFTKWLEHVKQKVLFDSAISQILSAELSALRQDFATHAPKKTTKD